MLQCIKCEFRNGNSNNLGIKRWQLTVSKGIFWQLFVWLLFLWYFFHIHFFSLSYDDFLFCVFVSELDCKKYFTHQMRLCICILRRHWCYLSAAIWSCVFVCSIFCRKWKNIYTHKFNFLFDSFIWRFLFLSVMWFSTRCVADMFVFLLSQRSTKNCFLFFNRRMFVSRVPNISTVGYVYEWIQNALLFINITLMIWKIDGNIRYQHTNNIHYGCVSIKKHHTTSKNGRPACDLDKIFSDVLPGIIIFRIFYG